MNHYAPVYDGSVIDAAEIGTSFTRTPTGWSVVWVRGGTKVMVQGPTIEEALASHGLHVVHPEPRKPAKPVPAPAEAVQDIPEEAVDVE